MKDNPTPMTSSAAIAKCLISLSLKCIFLVAGSVVA